MVYSFPKVLHVVTMYLNLRLEKAERKLAILRTPPSPQKLPLSPLHHSSVEELRLSKPHLSDDDLEFSSTTAASDMAHPQIHLAGNVTDMSAQHGDVG